MEGEDMEEEAQTEVLQQQCESCCSHTHGAPATKGELRLGGIMTKGGIEEPSPPSAVMYPYALLTQWEISFCGIRM